MRICYTYLYLEGENNMEINNELKEIDKEIENLEKELKRFEDKTTKKINEAYEKRNEIIEKGKKEGMIECKYCNKYSHNLDFSIIEKLETKIECTWSDPINSGGNDYAIIERKNTYYKCPKCKELFLVSSIKKSKSADYSRDARELKNFKPTSEIISIEENPRIAQKKKLTQQLEEQTNLVSLAEGKMKKISEELAKI